MIYILANYANISDSAANPADTWYAQNSTDGGNNTGWNINTGKDIFCKYLSIVDSAGTPANTWYAENSVDVGNNTGWFFFASPTSTNGINGLFFGVPF